MMLRRTPRPGATLVESALVYPVLFTVVLGIVMAGLTVFRYQQVAHAAREAARYASVRGARYAEDTGRPAATENAVYADVVAVHTPWVPRSGVTVTWDTDNRRTRTVPVTDPVTLLSKPTEITNTVSVTVTYAWNTGLLGTIPVSSTSVAVMSY